MLPARPGPFQEFPLFSFRRDLDRLFEDFFRDVGRGEIATGERALAPPMDVIEREGEYQVDAEIPGVEPKDIKVEVSGNTLTIQAERSEEKEEREGKTHLRERSSRRYYRSITLPEAVDPGKISAEYENGCVCITLPKSAAAKSRTIEVKSVEGKRQIEAPRKAGEKGGEKGGEKKVA